MTPRNLSIVSLGVTKVHVSAIRANRILASRPAPIPRKRPVMPMAPQKRNHAIMAVTASSVPKNRTIPSVRRPAPIQRRRPVIPMVPKTRNLVLMAVTESCVPTNRAIPSARHPAAIQRKRPVIPMVPKTRTTVIMAVTESCVLANRALVRGLRARTMAAATAVSV